MWTCGGPSTFEILKAKSGSKMYGGAWEMNGFLF